MTTNSAEGELSGTLNSISLASFVQMLAWEKSNSAILISAPEGEGYLYFAEGELVDAKTDSLQGVEAAYQICNYESPVMSISPYVARPRQINSPITQILLEASQFHDEKPTQQTQSSDEVHEPPKDTLLNHTGLDSHTELEILSSLPDVTQCAITDKQGNILAKSSEKIKFKSLVRFGIHTGKEIQSLLECEEQEYISITTTPGVLYLIPTQEKTFCILLKKETSPKQTIAKIKSALSQLQREKTA